MENLLIYLLKFAAFISIFYLSYLVLLRKETSFEWNRKFFLIGIFASAILPFIYFTKKVYIQASSYSSNVNPSPTQVLELKPSTSMDLWELAGGAYLCIAGFFLLKLILQLGSVFKLILQHKTEDDSGFKYLKTSKYQLPFSFFRYIVYNPSYHSDKDLKLILEHERVHARQFHSADIIIANLTSCVLWFNPLVWLYRKAMEQNLEFLADRGSINSKNEIKDYQYALLKVSVSNLKPAITNHFYKSFIKKRITMLNKKSSEKNPAWKISIMLPLVLALMFLFNLRTEAQIIRDEAKDASEKTEQNERTGLNSATNNIIQNSENLNELGKNPLYVINGKEYKSRKLKNKYVLINSNFEILIGQRATDRFGKNAGDGVVIVPEGEIMDNFEDEAKQLKKKERFSKHYIFINDNGKPNFVKLQLNEATASDNYSHKEIIITEDDFNPDEEGENVIMIKKIKQNGKTSYEYNVSDTVHRRIYKNTSANEARDTKKASLTNRDGTPIYIIDGEIDEDFKDSDLAPEDIGTINILKDEMAVAKYGKKAENGVVRIYTKHFLEKKNEEKLFVIRSDFDDARLKALQNEVKMKTDFELSLKNIVRNKSGLISNIEVKFQSDSQMVSGNYNENEGVPDIYFGIQKSGGVIITTAL